MNQTFCQLPTYSIFSILRPEVFNAKPAHAGFSCGMHRGFVTWADGFCDFASLRAE